MMANYLEKIKPQYSGYQELHVHTTGSFRDAANTVKDVFDAAENLGRNAVAITDHGNWTKLFEALKERTKREKKVLENELTEHGVDSDEIAAVLKTIGPFDSIKNPTDKMQPYIEKYEDAFVAAAKKSIQFVPGVEMYEADPVEGDMHRYHIVFYAKNWEGAKVLFALCNLAQLNKLPPKQSKNVDMPRCTIDTMRFFLGEGSRGHGNVIATSACVGGHIQSILLKPFYLAEKKDKLYHKMDEMQLVDSETIRNCEKRIETLTERYQKSKTELAEAKKLSKKNFDTLIARATKKLEKAEAKLPSGQMSFAGPSDSEAEAEVAALRNAVEALEESEKLARQYRERLPQMTLDTEKAKQDLKDAKESLKAFLKQNEPAEKIRAKIQALDEEAATIGNVYEEAKALAIEYDKILGRGNFYIELQNHGLLPETIARNQLIQIAKETGIPMTVANDVHYATPEMKRKRDIIASLRFPDQRVEDVANHPGNDQLWFKPNDMMMDLFKDVPEAIENTNRIAEACNVFYKKEMHLPEFVDEKYHLPPDEYLRKIAYDGIQRRFPDYDTWDKDRQKAFIDRLEYELGVIKKMGYSSYISIVEDFISWTKNHFSNESVGPGRGSGAGSLVCYLTGITNIDPLRYNLIFERFLNPERVSMPDIDTDLAPSARDKTVEYVARRYAYKEPYWVKELSGTVCSIYTEGVLAARSAIRQVGRVTSVPLYLCDKVAKLVPAEIGMTLTKALNDVDQLKQLYDQDPQVRQLYDDAMLVEGTPIQTGVHAAGVIIADKPISEYAPLFWNEKKNVWVIQYDMIACEGDLGLLKMDFLGLRNLDIIMKAKKFIAQRTHKNVDFFALTKADDPKVIAAIYGKGDTDGVFQFESAGMKQTLQSFVPKVIDDVILLNAAYRPGPMQYIPNVTDVKFGKKETKYIVPEMASILDSTYGSPIYQEQIQQIFHEIAGFSLGQADIIRRAMSKKHLDELQAAKGKFVEGFKSRGATDEGIEAFWQQLLEFAKYAFNKSHAAAYSIVSYYTAWLKFYYPTEYMAALMAYSTREDVPLYVKDVKDYNIELLGPDINKSVVLTSPTREGRSIRFGLDGIKDVGASAVKLVEERKTRGQYKDLRDFIIRCGIIGVDKGAIEGLIKAGAMDDIVANRQEVVANTADYLKACRDAIKKLLDENPELAEKVTADKASADQEIYDRLSDPLGFQLPEGVESEDYPYDEKLHKEKEYTGFYVSGNPLDKHKELMHRFTETELATITASAKDVELAGIVNDLKVLKRKKDGAQMCKFQLEDLTGTIDVVCFPNTYARIESQLSDGSIVYLKGSVEAETDEEGNVTSRQFIAQSGRKIA